MRNDFWKTLTGFGPRICFEADDGAGAGGAGGGDTAAGGGGMDTLAGGTGDDTAAGGSGGDAAKWWEGDGLKDHREMLIANGLTVDDPLEAIGKLAGMEKAAQQRLGKPADQLMDRPKEGQDIAEWLRGQGTTFGIPEKPEDYEIAKPEDWPKEAKWNEGLEVEARKIAHEEGIGGKGLSRMVGLYAAELQRMDKESSEELENTRVKMLDELGKDWGPQLQAKTIQAQQAASVLAEKAGLDAAAMADIASVLSAKTGDAAVIKMFATVGEMMGDDMLVALKGGALDLGTTPADARAKLAALQAPGGDYYKAVAEGNRAEMERLSPIIERLTKQSVT